ncbi:ATP-binding protein [Ramlibacter sp.]|uniref:ATP-binding protein n=1 Tax=Ramlibacter sp. TaxID=1917967 RepID=UPI002B777AD6|nr:AAA family ATPase [Ramlibacter sp.]HWI82402.1 AAA family ATPase [Ramlibacter sp.]
MPLPPLAQPRQLSIRLLGQFRLSAGAAAGASDTPQPPLGRRATELLQLLSLQPQRSLLHEQVIEALWPHLAPAAGSANLRKAAHHARQFVGEPDALVLRGGRVFLLPDRSVDCDAARFEQAADQALASGDALACKAAAELYGGELLPQARYEAWTEAPRQRLREKYLRLLRQAGDLERLVREEPTDEAAHLRLMREELAAGRRSSALRWYGHLRDHLRQGIGVAPGPQVEALYLECVAGMEGAAPRFVGRALELVRVLALLRASLAGGPGAVLVRAAAGFGKSAFCRRVAEEARGLGWQVRALQASDWSRPYGITADLVEPLLRECPQAPQAIGPHAQAVLAAMTSADGAGPRLALPLGRHQVVGAVRRLLLATAAGKPVLLMVDDAHAADDASIEMLVQLAAAGPPVCVLLACRPALTDLLQRQVARLLRAGQLEAIDLGPLGEEEAALLAQRAAVAPLSAAAAARIARRSEGIPFAVVELAQASPMAGDEADPDVPRGVSAAIAERLCDVAPGALEALRRLALSAEVFDVATAIALADDPGHDPLARLDAALASGVLVVAEGRYRLRHALVRQALVDGVPPHRRVALHRDVAARLERAAAPPGLVGRHWLAAGEPDRAAPWSLAAARDAFRLGAFEDVLRHVEPLLAHRPMQPEALALRAEALDALGRAGTLAAYDAAAEVAPEAQAHELRAKRALAQVKMSDPPGALKYLQGVHPTTVAGRLAEALAYSGAAALGFGDPAEGSRRAAQVRRLALETVDEGTLVIASWAQAAAAHARGDLHGSVWADLRETGHLPHLAVRVFDGHLCITQRFLYGARPYADVIAFADALAAEALRLGAARGHAFAVTLRGEAKLLSGQLDAAEDDLVAGARLHRAIGGATGEALALQRRAELAMYRGRLDLARGLVDDALDVARQSGVGFHLLDRIYGTRIAIASDPDAALCVVEEAEAGVRGPLETCPGCRITFAIPATIAAARAHEMEMASSHERAAEYLANVVMKLPAWYAALHEARAHVALAAGELDAAREGFASAARGFHGCGHPLEEARCRALVGARAGQA